MAQEILAQRVAFLSHWKFIFRPTTTCSRRARRRNRSVISNKLPVITSRRKAKNIKVEKPFIMSIEEEHDSVGIKTFYFLFLIGALL